MVTLRHAGRSRDRAAWTASPVAERYELGRLIVLHLTPGLVFTIFLVVATYLFESWDIDPSFALFGGIGLVLVPIELGYLALYAWRTTGSWSPLDAVEFSERVPARRLVRLAGGLAIWFYAILIPSMLFIDKPLASHLFSWMPNALLQATGMEEAANAASGGEVAWLLLIAFLFNGIAGPITEELYFRGHLLPKMERYGRWAPVLNTVFFSIYHFFSPWRYPAIILGFLPITWMAWRTRSIYVSIAAHMTINMLTILLLIAASLE